MTKRREKWVTVLMTLTAGAALCCLIGCPPPVVRETTDYQEIGIVQLENRFVPSQVFLVKGKPARLHITNGINRTTDFKIALLDLRAELKPGELTRLTITADEVDALDRRKFSCTETANSGVFRVQKANMPVSPLSTGTAEVAIVMTDDLAAPRELVVRRGVPLRIYVAKIRGVEEDDILEIEVWNIKEEVKVGAASVINYTPDKTGEATFLGITTPSSRGTIRVVD